MLRQHQAEVKDMASRFECIKSSLVVSKLVAICCL